jgi:hypothetical protein
MIERVLTTVRYIQPFRQGGSVPALVEADDGELYVLKFRAAAQGRRALVAELLAGEIGRILGLRVPQLALINVEPRFGMGEAHQEISEMLNASAGLNLGLRFLPDSLEYNPLLKPPPAPGEAAAIVWFDAFVTNVDRTPRNVNLLLHERQLWLIDHGAALYFHHSPGWYAEPALGQKALAPFALVKDHVLLRFAGSLCEADKMLKPLLSAGAVESIVGLLPDDWLLDGVPPVQMRLAYARWLTARLAASQVFVDEAENARTRAI